MVCPFTVDRQECVVLDRLIARVSGQDFDPSTTTKVWKAMDADGDGDVTRDEYVGAQMAHVPLEECILMAAVLEEMLDGVDQLKLDMAAAKDHLKLLFQTSFRIAEADGPRSRGGMFLP